MASTSSSKSKKGGQISDFFFKKKNSEEQRDADQTESTSDVSVDDPEPETKRQRLADVPEEEIIKNSGDEVESETDELPDYVLAEDVEQEDNQNVDHDEEDLTATRSIPGENSVPTTISEKKAAGPPDISCYPRDGPQQQKLKSYRKDDKKRSFTSNWFEEYPWLEYSISKDSAFCFVCRHFAPTHSTPETAYTSVGFKTWKRVKEKKKGFTAHANSACHKQAWLAWVDYKKMKQLDTSVLQMASDAYKKEVQENREYIKTLADVLLLTAKQNIAQRGHREQAKHLKQDDEDGVHSGNRGNFLEILTLIAKNNPVIARRLVEIPQNAKYTSPKIQNEIINVLAEMVRKDIVDNIKESGEFALMVDETKDVSKTEQLSFVIRYYSDGTVKESFIMFKAAEHLDAKHLSETIISCLEGLGLNYKEKLVGQGYDGAAVMSGKHKGVATLIQQDAPYAHYVHCHAHRLNLALVDTAKCVQEAADFFALLERLYVFMSRSYVHPRFIEVQRELYPKYAPRELQRLSDTRWACRYISCRNVSDRLPAIMKVLNLISEEDNAERAIEARGLLSQLNFSFVVMLDIFGALLQNSKGLSDMLQNPKVDLAKATDIIEGCKEDLKASRSDENNFDTIWKSAKEIANACGISVSHGDIRPRRQRRLPAVLQDSIVTEPLPTQQQISTSKNDIRAHVFYPILDALIAEMERRFSVESCSIMKGIQSLNPASSTFLSVEDVKQFGQFFDASMEDLSHEVPQAKRLLERKFTKCGKALPKTLLMLTAFLEPYKDVFEELFRLCKIGVTIPVSSAACERSFSTLKLIKTYLRNTMTDKRLSDLGVLHIEKELTDALDLDYFIDVFADQHKNLKINLF